MTETETQPLPPSAQPADIAAGIAKDAQENLAGLDVVSVGPMFANEIAGELYAQVHIVLPNRAPDDFVVHLITLVHVQDLLLAQVNRTALIMALETHFGRVQIFSHELAFAKYCQKEWSGETINQVVAGLINRRGLN
jgi:hypothetical protein